MERPVVALRRDAAIGETPGEYTQESFGRIKDLVADALGLCTDLSALVRGKTVLLKPNLVRPSTHNPYGIVTDERVVLAVVELLWDAGARELWLGDNPGYGLPLRTAMEQTVGVREKLEKRGVKVRFFDDEDKVTLENPGAFFFEKMVLPKCLLDAEVYVNLPKMKTHMHTLVTLGVKNQYGLILDDQRMTFHRNDIHMKIVDILRRVAPDLTLIDGIVAVQGQAPLSGSTIPDMNTLVASTEVVAADAVAASAMGIHPEEVAILRLARQEGLGEIDLEKMDVRGDALDTVRRPFRRPVIHCMGAYPQVDVREGGACFGCLSALRHALDKLFMEGRLQGRPTNTVYVGKPMPNIRNVCQVDGELWCFGSCAADLVFDHQKCGKERARFVPGCPPHILDFYKAYLDAYGNEENGE